MYEGKSSENCIRIRPIPRSWDFICPEPNETIRRWNRCIKLILRQGNRNFYAKDGTKSVISAVISILIGMIVGTLIIIIVGLTKKASV